MKLTLRAGLSPILVMGVASILVCVSVILIRNLGGLQFLELFAYDHYLKLLPADTKANAGGQRIVLVTVSEEDIHRQGHWPLTDHTLALLLRTLGESGPRAIGLDIYRDIPEPPGRRELLDVFSRYQNIIVSVKKVGDNKAATIPPPYSMKNLDLVGFNDIKMDRGGIVRRGLLFIDDGTTTSYSFSLLLAMLYLQTDGILPTPESSFTPDEFKDGLTVSALCDALSRDGHHPNSQSPPDTVEWLNEMLTRNDLYDRVTRSKRSQLPSQRLKSLKAAYDQTGNGADLALLNRVLLEEFYPRETPKSTGYFRLGKTTFVPFEPNDGGYRNADARGYQFLLDFGDMERPFPSYSVSDVLSGKIPRDAFKDRIVLIGVTAVSMRDFFITPFNKTMESDQQIAGVELHARIVSQLLRSALEGHKSFRYMNERHEWAWIFLWGLFGGALGLLGRSLSRFFLLGIASFFLLILVTFGAFRMGWWIPLVPPALAWAASDAAVTAYISYREKAERATLMQLFSRHVSPDVATAIWKEREHFMDGNRPRSQKLTATVLFSDLKDFTAVAEKLDPQSLMDWLNEYMEAMARVIIEHGGVVNKYMGDSIMAVFGVPVPRTDESEISRDAVNATDCALSMAEELGKLNERWREGNLPVTRMRIGIYTGPLVAGSLGSAQRMEYTVIGDTVNVASRLESFDRGLEGDPARDCRILVGERTLNYLGGAYHTEKMGAVSLKGKEEKIIIYMIKRRDGKDVGDSGTA
jgi:CHASE2 domain-containing sensor protein/class 3 adenylate cyclase